MAKSKKKKTTVRRKRRVSGITSKMDLQAIGLGIAGAVVANKLSGMLASSTNATMQKLAPYVGLAGGIVLPMIVKNPMVKALGAGMAVGGGVDALKALKVISGVRGVYQVPVINGTVNTLGNTRRLPAKRAAGVGFPLPNNSVNNGAMSVVSGVRRNHAGSGAGASY